MPLLHGVFRVYKVLEECCHILFRESLAPHEVIPSVLEDKPYGQGTDLVWAIVGIVDPDEHETCNPFRASHRIVTQQVPSNGIFSFLSISMKKSRMSFLANVTFISVFARFGHSSSLSCP